MLIDAHNHIQDQVFDSDRTAVLALALENGVGVFLCNATCEDDWDLVLDLYDKLPQRIIPCLGIHPWYVDRITTGWVDKLENILERSGALIGEIGLDRWRPQRDEQLQEEVFIKQMVLANRLNRPVIIHCLKAWGWLINVLEQMQIRELPPAMVIHACSASVEVMLWLAAKGAYFSFAGNILEPRKERMRQTLLAVPRDRLLLETDAPDIVPPETARPFGQIRTDGKYRNEPANLAAIYRGVSGILNMAENELEEMIESNFKRLIDDTVFKCIYE